MNRVATSVPDGGQVLITVQEAARRLAISRSHLYQHLQLGALPSMHIGRARRIRVADLEAFVERLQDEQGEVQLPAVNSVPAVPDVDVGCRPG